MSVLSWIFWAIIFVGMLGFSLSNTNTATLRFFGSSLEWSAPLVVHLLAFFVCGIVFGLLAVLPSWYKGRRKIAALEREVRKLGQEIKAVAPVNVPTADTVKTPPPLPLTGL